MNLKLVCLTALAVSLSGCISVKSYVDPKFADISYTDVVIPQDTKINLTTEFYRDGKANKGGAKELAKIANKVFEKAGITQAEDGTKLKVSANNIADMGDAVGKGVATGLTLGLAGSTVTDGYEFTFELQDGQGTTTKTYSHALHSTIGNADAPIAGVEAMTPIAGFEAVFEDVLLTFLKEMNAENRIAMANPRITLAP